MSYNIGIIVSENYSNTRKIKEEIFKLKEGFKNYLTIYMINDNSFLNIIVKKFIIELGIDFKEILKYDENYSQYCVNPSYFYNKKFRKEYFHIRNKEFIKLCKGIYFFIDKKDENKGISDILLKEVIKKNKDKIILN